MQRDDVCIATPAPRGSVTSAGNSKNANRKRGGRRRVGYAEEDRRLKLCKARDEDKEVKIAMKDFCENEGIPLSELLKALDWRAKRRSHGY
jgi:hypothetical protein